MTIESAPMTDTETSDWVLVPREPTPEMLNAPLPDKAGVYAHPVFESRRDLRPTIYRTMLAAAPKPQGDDLEPTLASAFAALAASQTDLEPEFKAALADRAALYSNFSEGDDLEPVADDLVERLRAHEGIGAAMAPTHGTGRYVCAIMDEAASALQFLKAERDAALRIINMSPADQSRSAVLRRLETQRRREMASGYQTFGNNLDWWPEKATERAARAVKVAPISLTEADLARHIDEMLARQANAAALADVTEKVCGDVLGTVKGSGE